MTKTGQQLTKQAYEDPDLVEGFIQRNGLSPKQAAAIRAFAVDLPRGPLLDLGCGPGQDSYLFAELGFETIGLDYSQEMIRRAKTLRQLPQPPQFMVGDMRRLPEYFPPDHFVAIWAAASLFHVELIELPQVLSGMHRVALPDAKIYIGLKGGAHETLLVEEDKYTAQNAPQTHKRQFTIWTKEDFLAQVAPLGWELSHFDSREGSPFLGRPTEWLNFYFVVRK